MKICHNRPFWLKINMSHNCIFNFEISCNTFCKNITINSINLRPSLLLLIKKGNSFEFHIAFILSCAKFLSLRLKMSKCFRMFCACLAVHLRKTFFFLCRCHFLLYEWLTKSSKTKDIIPWEFHPCQ